MISEAFQGVLGSFKGHHEVSKTFKGVLGAFQGVSWALNEVGRGFMGVSAGLTEVPWGLRSTLSGLSEFQGAQVRFERVLGRFRESHERLWSFQRVPEIIRGLLEGPRRCQRVTLELRCI